MCLSLNQSSLCENGSSLYLCVILGHSGFRKPIFGIFCGGPCDYSDSPSLLLLGIVFVNLRIKSIKKMSRL